MYTQLCTCQSQTRCRIEQVKVYSHRCDTTDIVRMSLLTQIDSFYRKQREHASPKSTLKSYLPLKTTKTRTPIHKNPNARTGQ